MSITFVSCFYIIKSKFQPNKYLEWMNNFISIVNNFNLVIYTDNESTKYIKTNYNEKIKIIIKPLTEFYNYKYKDFWVNNHIKNNLLNDKSSWELNMLWAEKINFVRDTIERKYFQTDFYGWCDIGYFRNRQGDYYNDTNINELQNWPNLNKINMLDKNKILYACINNDEFYLHNLIQNIQSKNSFGLPIKPIPSNQNSIAGGFFILHKDNISWWSETFDTTLSNYFQHNYLVKDDQIILADCIFTNIEKFILFRENNYKYDNWFMFQRLLN